MLMCGIHHHLHVKKHFQFIDNALCSVIHIKRDGGSGDHAILLPSSALQLSKDESSDILDIVLLSFRHLPVLLHCFRSIFCLGQTADKIFICHIRTVKLFVHS